MVCALCGCGGAILRVSTGVKTGEMVSLPNGDRVQATIITIKTAERPKLRFDRTAVGFLDPIKKAVEKAIPFAKTVVVTCTAPICQDSKTSKALEVEIAKLIASRKTNFLATIFNNRVQVRILRGNGPGALIGFIHNPVPNPEILFDLTRALVRSIDLRRHARADRTLVICCKYQGLPIRALEQICEALGVDAAFPTILVSASNGFRPL